MTMKKKSIAVAFATLAIMVPLGYLAVRQQAAAPAAPPLAITVIAAKANGPDELSYPAGAPQLTMIRSRPLPAAAMPVGGMLSARVVYDEAATARLGAGVAGRVVAIKAAPGDRVKAGQVLAEIDSPEFGAALADLDKAKADEAQKHLVAERARALGAGEGIARKDLEAAETELAMARAETLRTTLRVRNLSPSGMHAHGQRMALASPINGVVAEYAINPSLQVGPDTASPLFVVTDPKRLWLLLDVPEAMLSRVLLGTHVDVQSDAFPDEYFTATITQLGQAVDPDTRRAVVRAKLDNPDARLLPGMFVRAALLQEHGNAVKVPNSALVNRGLYTYVFVESAPGRFQRRQVELLTHGGDFSYLGQGVHGNDRIVIDGALLLDAEMSNRAGIAP